MRDRHGRRRSPDERRRSPEDRRRSPDGHRRSPEDRRRSPEERRRSPEERRRSPEERRRSPEERRRSPDERRRSPDDRRRSPEDRRRKRSPDGRRRSPEVEKKMCKRRKRMEERAKQDRSSPSQNETRTKSRFERESEKWGKSGEEDTKKKPKVNVAKPDFKLSGKLAEETNTYHGVVIKYAEPPEAGKPKRRWRLYPFKGNDVLPTLYIHRQSAYLIGRDRKVADLPIDHPSCSKQHAALQYRIVPYTREDGLKSRRIRPYIIDLDSANGTFINGQKIESRKYVELMERDVIKFAFSSREYVLLHEHSQDDDAEEDDNVNINN